MCAYILYYCLMCVNAIYKCIAYGKKKLLLYVKLSSSTDSSVYLNSSICSILTCIVHMGSCRISDTVLGKSELKAGSIQHKTDCNRLKIAPEDCRNCYKGQTEEKAIAGWWDMWCKLCCVKFPLEFGVIQGRLGRFATVALFPKTFRKNCLPFYPNRSKVFVVIYNKNE